jgi:glutamate-1-semialdehyde 2,1-aminomutase
MSLFDQTGVPERDRFDRVTHLGTFNAAPLSAAAGISVLKRVASGQVIARADALASQLRAAFNDVLSKHQIAGYVYGPSSTFHVYFEKNPERLRLRANRKDLETTDAKLLKGMPGSLITEYQRRLRFHGVDIMSSTGGLLSAAHAERDIQEATEAFEQTVLALLDEGLIYRF